MTKQRTPALGQSVFIPFVTDGEGIKVKGAALVPFDRIVAVYSDTELSQHGKKIFSVQVASGDAVKIIDKDDKWQAVA